MKKMFFGLAALLLLIQLDTQAQSVRRSVISSFGDSGEAGGIRLSCTGAQPPNAGTIENGGIILRQGFQQPLKPSNIDPNCVNAPMADFAVDNFIDVCGEKFSFDYDDTPEAATVFSWNFGQDAIPATSSSESPLGIVYATIGPKIVTLEVTTGSCVFTNTYALTVTKASFAAYPQTTPVSCSYDANGTANLVVVNAQGLLGYKWSNNATTSSISGLRPGPYYFTVTDGIGCSFSSEAVVGGPDSLSFGTAITVETCTDAKDGAVNLTMSGGYAPYTFQWSTGATTEDILNISGGVYSVVVTDSLLCKNSLELLVQTVCEGVDVPNLITPNGDGSNDNWTIPGIESFPNNEMEIFNRWGDKVFGQKGFNNTWQGTNDKGQPLPIGAYWYVLNLNDTAQTVLKGSISILR